MQLGSLTVEIGADTSGLTKAEGEVKKSTGRMEASFSRLGSAIVAAFSVETARQITMVADRMTRLEGTLKRLTRTTGDFNKVYEDLTRVSNENGTAISDSIALFQRFQASLKSVTDQNDDVVEFIDQLQKLGRIGGSSAEELSNALIQLSQGLSGGIIRAEEWNSIIEQAPEILKTVASNIQGVNGDLGKLRQIMLDGKLDAETFFNALMAGAEDTNKEFMELPRTIDMAAASLNNNLSKAISNFDKAIGGSQNIAEFIDWLSGAADDAAHFWGTFNEGSQAQISSRMADIVDEIKSLEEEMENAETAAGRFYNVVTFGSNEVEFNKKKVEDLREEYSKLQTKLTEMRTGGGAVDLTMTPKIPTVSAPTGGKSDPTGDEIKRLQLLADVYQDTGAKIDAELLRQRQRAVEIYGEGAKELEDIDRQLNENRVEMWSEALGEMETTNKETNDEIAQDIANAYMSMNRTIGDQLGQALVGTQSWSDAMKTIIADLASQFIAAGLGSVFGVSAGSGNIFASMFSGGGRAMGGQTSGMLAHPINERGTPEILEMSGQQYLLPTGKTGKISPMQQGGMGQPNVSIISTGEPQQISASSFDGEEVQIMIDNAIRSYDDGLNASLSRGKGRISKSLQSGYNVNRNMGVR